MANSVDRGSLVRVLTYVYDEDDNAYDPTWVKVAATADNGTSLLTSTTMTKDTTGTYYYDWQTPTATTVPRGGVDFMVSMLCSGSTAMKGGRLITLV